jgi:hypothetical protein
VQVTAVQAFKAVKNTRNNLSAQSISESATFLVRGANYSLAARMQKIDFDFLLLPAFNEKVD